MTTKPRAWIEVDLGAIARNARRLRAIAGRGTGLMAVVKSNGYGHGMVPVARALARAGANYLAVTQPQEGLELRDAGIRLPILVMGPTDPWEIAESVRRRLTLTVYSEIFGARVARSARRLGAPARVHVKVDTGMGRMGVWCSEAPSLVAALAALRPLTVEGMYTHFPNAEEEPGFTHEQIRLFRQTLDQVAARRLRLRWHHAANSAALLQYPQAHFNLVRPGLALYGLRSAPSIGASVRLEPALSLKARVTDVRLVPAGRSISYGRTYVTQRPTRIATLPIGYADGYSRALSNRATILVNGRRASVAGRVCMDFTMVDVGRCGPVRPGDEVVLIGRAGARGVASSPSDSHRAGARGVASSPSDSHRAGDHEIRAEDLAQLVGTIPYEVVCALSHRLPRVYRTSATSLRLQSDQPLLESAV